MDRPRGPAKPRILFVEGDAGTLDALVTFFRKQKGDGVMGAKTSAEALAVIAETPPDIVVIDVLRRGPEGALDVDGFQLCSMLRDAGFSRPVIFLAHRGTEPDKLLGFEAGGDDYVTRPFSMLVLKARIEANLRRCC